MNITVIVKKTFDCAQCEYKATTSGHLKRHIKAVHDKIKDIACLQCDFKCSSNGDLKQHLKQVHDKLKDIKCVQCDFKCCANSDLKRHVKSIHDDPKPKNMTRGEKAIYDHLLSTDYEFKKTFFREVTFNDVIGLGGNKLRFDFKVMIDDVKFVFIEFDGAQHFRPINFGGGKTAQQILDDFKTIRTHDRIKDCYCTDNGIPILRIKYDQVDLSGVMVDEFIRLNK